jgi:hypothetical protein
MSMRISYLEEVKKKPTSNNNNNFKSTTLNNNGIYLKQIPRRSKSPFRKYEVAVKESNKSQSSVTPFYCSNKSNSISNIITDQNHHHQPEMKLINNFQDLVIACVDSNHTHISQENSLYCYKQKYSLNLTNNNNDEEEIKSKTYCSRCGQLENDLKLVNLTTQNMESLKREDDLLRKKVFEGDSDPITFRRLEYIVELIKKLKQIDNNINKNQILSSTTTSFNKQNGKIQILKQKRQLYKQSHQMKCVKSLSDSAFHSELKLHPLIKKNSIYLN